MEFYYLLLDKSNERLIYSQINILFKKIKTILKYYLVINIKVSFLFVFSNLIYLYNTIKKYSHFKLFVNKHIF